MSDSAVPSPAAAATGATTSAAASPALTATGAALIATGAASPAADNAAIATDPLARYDEATRRSIEALRALIAACPPGKLVFFGGAGVSTESGIPDFRSADGLYAEKLPVPPEVIISHSYFVEHPAEFYDYYTSRMIARSARPNAAHRKLAQLEADGVLSAVITQNIDGLHQAAGSKRVLELHGSVLRNSCEDCGAFYDLDDLLAARQASLDAGGDGVPRCNRRDCCGIIKPDVVLYEEALDSRVMRDAVNAIRSAGLMIIAGTSLAVYPAAGLVDYFRGSHLVIINRDATPKDYAADLVIRANVGDVLNF